MKNMLLQKTTLETSNWKFRFIDEGFFDISLKQGTRLPPINKKDRLKIRISFMLVEAPHGKYLIDLGLGNFPNKMFVQSPHSKYQSVEEKLLPAIKSEINAIIFSHLHTDHIGGYLDFFKDSYKINFPGIPCYINKKEWAFRMKRQNEYDKTFKTYLKELEPNIRLTNTGDELLPGICIFCTGGHTPGHQTILFRADDQKVIYTGDLIATETQMAKNRSLPYDFDPAESRRLREVIYLEAQKNNWIFALNHSPHTKFSSLDKNEKKLYISPHA